MDRWPAANSGADQEHTDHPRTFGQRLRRLRKQRQWSQSALAYHFRAVAATYRRAAQLDSLVKMISKWEGDRLRPDQYNRHILAETLGVTVADLGLDVDPDFVLRRAHPAGIQPTARH